MPPRARLGARRVPSSPSRGRRRPLSPRARRPRPAGTWPGHGSRRGRAGALASLQALEDPEPVAQQARREEVLADVLLAGPAELLAELGLAEDAERAVGA